MPLHPRQAYVFLKKHLEKTSSLEIQGSKGIRPLIMKEKCEKDLQGASVHQ